MASAASAATNDERRIDPSVVHSPESLDGAGGRGHGCGVLSETTSPVLYDEDALAGDSSDR
jgi:hypothetical protein